MNDEVVRSITLQFETGRYCDVKSEENITHIIITRFPTQSSGAIQLSSLIIDEDDLEQDVLITFKD